jgi:adenylosuccinate synthase
MILADVVLGLQQGDEGKGKVTKELASDSRYTHVMRFNGGNNAGHTVYHGGKKLVTHYVPQGVFYGKKSIIGPGCVINPESLFSEMEYLTSHGVNVQEKIFVAQNAHVTTQNHINEEAEELKIGTTRKGIGGTYRDKYARTGIRAEEVPELRGMLIDITEELNHTSSAYLLMEGAQAYYLDIDWGDYPYVTSSHCGVGGVVQNGIPHNSIRRVFGVAKVYETYVGSKDFEGQGNEVVFKTGEIVDQTYIFSRIRQCGEEFGATTNKPKQYN